MRASTWGARLLTAPLGVIGAIVGLGLLSSGGLRWQFAVQAMSSGFDTGDGGILVPALQIGGGILLLALVVFSGVWSSAGLLAAGALTIVPLLLTFVPEVTMTVYRIFGEMVPREWMDGLLMGTPLMVLPVFGGLGLALMGLRRHPEPAPTPLRIGGLFAVPLLLFAGGWALVWGNGVASTRLVQLFNFNPDPMALLAIIGGIVIVVIALGMLRWSPYAVLVPSLALIIGVIVSAVAPLVLYESLLPLNQVLAGQVMQLMATGIALAVAVIYLTFTVTAIIVRRRGMRTARPGELPGVTAGFATVMPSDQQVWPPAPPAYSPVSPAQPQVPPTYPPAAPPAQGTGDSSPWQRP